MNEIAAERAREFEIAGQQAGESDCAFGHRVVLELRRAGKVLAGCVFVGMEAE